MAQGDTNITVVGNLVADPEIRYTPNGAAVANFRVASQSRRYDAQSGGWVDQDPMYMSCNAWRQLAENVAQSLTKGMRVVVTGVLRQRSYETQQGEKRTVYEVAVDEIGPSLRYATAEVTRNPRDNNGGGNFGGNQNSGFNNNSAQFGGNQGGFGGNSAPASDPWGSAPDSSFSGHDDDAPPF